MNTGIVKTVCDSPLMINRHMVRGMYERVYYADNLKIIEIMLTSSNQEKNETSRREVYQLTGETILAFESDNDPQYALEEDQSKPFIGFFILVDSKNT